MDVHGAAVADEIPAPDAFEDEFAREHLPFVFRKEDQQFVLLRLELDRLAVEGHFAAGEVDGEVAEGQFFVLDLVCAVLPISSCMRRVRRSWALTRAISSRMEKGLVR